MNSSLEIFDLKEDTPIANTTLDLIILPKTWTTCEFE